MSERLTDEELDELEEALAGALEDSEKPNRWYRLRALLAEVREEREYSRLAPLEAAKQFLEEHPDPPDVYSLAGLIASGRTAAVARGMREGQERAAEARELLAELEWCSTEEGFNPSCPVCHASNPGWMPPLPPGKHKSGCKLAALLGVLPGVTRARNQEG